MRRTHNGFGLNTLCGIEPGERVGRGARGASPMSNCVLPRVYPVICRSRAEFLDWSSLCFHLAGSEGRPSNISIVGPGEVRAGAQGYCSGA